MSFDRPERPSRPPSRPFNQPFRPRPARGRQDDAVARAPAPEGSENFLTPWVAMKYFSYSPAIFPRFIKAVSPNIPPGTLVHVYDKDARHFGTGFYHSTARVPLRVAHHGMEPVGEEWFIQRLEQSVALRKDLLRLDEVTDAYRVVHGDSDSLGGLTVDRYGDVLSVEVTNLAVWQRLGQWLPVLHDALGTTREVVQVDDFAAKIEGIRPPAREEGEEEKPVKIKEYGLRFEVSFANGHKTGFFCDQRENRRRFGQMVKGRRVLDLCCYTGGFSIAAKLGGATEVTGVDLDEKSIEQAKRNANLNQTRINWVHSDAFDYARQMKTNGQSYDAVVLDPPKLIFSRDEPDEGMVKYRDLNLLALNVVAPGGLFVTCSCSGLLSVEDFESMVIAAAHRLGRKLQIIDRTGPGPDHPVMSNCPESRYLKVLWALVW